MNGLNNPIGYKSNQPLEKPFIMNPFRFGVGEVGAWKEVGRTILPSNTANIDVTGIADKKYYMILQNFSPSTGSGNPYFKINNDVGTNFATRYSRNGGTDGTIVNSSAGWFAGNISNTNKPFFIVSYVSNLSSKEKLGIQSMVNQNTAGSGTAPNRGEVVGKWSNTSDVISEFNVNGNGVDISAGGECVVLGWDPTDTHSTDDNFWQELDDSTWSSGDSWTSGTFTAKKYLWVQFYSTSSGGSNYFRFNGDSGTNYANRYSINGATDSTIGTQPESYLGAIDGLSFNNVFIVNTSSNEKLLIADRVSRSTAGSATSPTRMESVGKWANTSSQITSITVTTAGGGSFTSGQMKVWGHD